MFQVDCDASGTMIGAILSQEGIYVAYLSEKLNDAKKLCIYYVYDQEFYVIVQGLKKWRHYLLPKEFILYTNHLALQYLNSQRKLNQRHLKWVEFLHSYTFVLKHRSGKSNKVIDSLSRRQLFLTKMQIEVVEFKELKNLYPKDCDFGEAWKAYIKYITLDKMKWLDFIIQDGMLLKGSHLYIPRSSTRENLIKEKHSGGLTGNFGRDKNISLVVENYYQP